MSAAPSSQLLQHHLNLVVPFFRMKAESGSQLLSLSLFSLSSLSFSLLSVSHARHGL